MKHLLVEKLRTIVYVKSGHTSIDHYTQEQHNGTLGVRGKFVLSKAIGLWTRTRTSLGRVHVDSPSPGIRKTH